MMGGMIRIFHRFVTLKITTDVSATHHQPRLHDPILLMEEILHHLGWCYNPVNNGISTISTGDRRISEPSTVAARGRVQWRSNVWTLNWAGQSRRGRVH